MDDPGEKRIVVNGVIAPGKPGDLKPLVRDLFDRIATALEAGELPTVKDVADLELLVLEYWEKDKDPERLGLITRVFNRQPQPVEPLAKDEIRSVVNHLVCRRTHTKGQQFAFLIRRYLSGTITIAGLLGARDKEAGYPWQYRDQMGEIAEWVHRLLIDPETGKHLLKTGNETLIGNADINEMYGDADAADADDDDNEDFCKGLYVNLYDLLAALSAADADIEKIKKRYKLLSDHYHQILIDARETLISINAALSPPQWRDRHQDFRKNCKSLHPK